MRVTPGKNGSQADIELEFWLENAESLPEGSMIEAEILDDGVTVAKTAIPVMTGSSSGTVLPGGCQTETPLIAHFSTHLTIDYPHLWQGRRDPHLYTAAARLTGTDSGRGGDEVSLRFGCRTFYVDPEKGFFLNGEPYPLRGVSRHQDREGVGNALIKEMHREDIELIAETGANSIRLAHYQHDPYFYDLCDEYGMVVWAEIPYITVQLDNGRENILSQMRELIIQNHHHAAICFWGISNEITAGGFSEAVLENNKALDKLAKELDPARLTAMACAFMMEDDCPLSDVTDVIAYNHYFGWYTGELEDNDQWFDGFHRKYPKKCAGLSEYGAEAVLSWQTGCPQRGDYTEQYQAVYHEHMLKMIEDRPFLWCTYVWNMFDFAADGRDEGGVKGRNNKGLVTFDRKIKKDAFYLYKAYWSEEPFLHLAGKRYKNRAEKETEIIVYTNQNHVELFQNGKAVGSLDGKHVFRFQVLLEEKNEIRALAGEGLEDRMMICRVEKPDPSYSMPVLESVSNWLDDIGEAKDGFFSLEDRVKDLVQDPEGMALFREFMEVYDGRRKGAAAAVHMTEEQRLKTMSSMRLKELMRRTNTPPEEVRMWAERLQRIPRK